MDDGSVRIHPSMDDGWMTVVFGYVEGSFLVSRTGDARERYDPNLRWEPWYQGTRAPQPWALVPGHIFIFIFIFFGGSSFFSRLG
jgi:hypothetical protein